MEIILDHGSPRSSPICADFPDFRQADLRRSFIVESDNSSQFDGKKFYIPETEIIFDIYNKSRKLIGFTEFFQNENYSKRFLR